MKKRFAAVLTTIALSACTRTLDTAAIESEIQADLTSQAKIPVRSIVCPANIQSEVGQTFECVGALNPDGGFFITVTQEDEGGNISWEVPNSWRLLNLSSLATEFQKNLGTSIEVNCGEGYRPTKAGDSFECKLSGRSPIDTILVKVEPEGNVTWREVKVVAARPAATPATSTPTASASTSEAASAPAPAAPAAVPPATDSIGAQDETGWVQLGD